MTTYCGATTFTAWTGITIGATSYITSTQFVLFQQGAADYMDNEITATTVSQQSTYWQERVCSWVCAYFAYSAKSATVMTGSVKYKIGDITEDTTGDSDVLMLQAERFLTMANTELAKYRAWSWKRVLGEPQAYSETEESR